MSRIDWTDPLAVARWALEPIALASEENPGESDLYDEQRVSITLGDVRRARTALHLLRELLSAPKAALTVAQQEIAALKDIIKSLDGERDAAHELLTFWRNHDKGACGATQARREGMEEAAKIARRTCIPDCLAPSGDGGLTNTPDAIRAAAKEPK